MNHRIIKVNVQALEIGKATINNIKLKSISPAALFKTFNKLAA